MTTIYIVTTGNGKHWRIRGAYDDRELATRLALLFIGNVEEVELNANKYDEYLKRNEVYFRVCIHTAKTAQIENKHKTAAQAKTVEGDAWAQRASIGDLDYNKESELHPQIARKAHIYYVWARDEEHARKIAGERHANWLAAGDTIGRG